MNKFLFVVGFVVVVSFFFFFFNLPPYEQPHPEHSTLPNVTRLNCAELILYTDIKGFSVSLSFSHLLRVRVRARLSHMATHKP